MMNDSVQPLSFEELILTVKGAIDLNKLRKFPYEFTEKYG